MKKAHIKTYGCQMNEQDSAQMHGLLSQAGYQKSDDVFDADLILLNTCSIREKAVHKIYSELGRIRPLKEDNPDLIVGIAGCVAEQEKSKISRRFPFLDLVFGPDHIRKLPQMLNQILEQRNDFATLRQCDSAKNKELQSHKVTKSQSQTIVRTGFERRQDFEFVNVLPHTDETPVKAFVNIQKGCDNICSFCIVPFVRGREVSRSHQEIIDEVQALVDRGVKEVMLLGQNVNSYGLKTTGGVTFAQLLELIAIKTKLKRLRFTTSHPKDVKDDLMDQFEHNPILAPHFHLPVQSGSDRILQLMKRQYTSKHYLDTIDALKKRVPHIRFSTDIIVGFPSESDDDFEQTLSLMQTVRFNQTFSFVYSPRPYTKAIELVDDIAQSIKDDRLQKLQALDKKIMIEENQADVDSLQEVLVECYDEENAVYPCQGRTLYNKVVHFKGQARPGDFVTVKITQANPYSLYGEL